MWQTVFRFRWKDASFLTAATCCEMCLFASSKFFAGINTGAVWVKFLDKCTENFSKRLQRRTNMTFQIRK